MTPSAGSIREQLCASFCRDVGVVERAGEFAISLPMSGRDGDGIVAYATATDTGWRVSDKGATLMRLSYEHDLNKLLTGARERLFNNVLLESGLAEDDGELYLNVAADGLQHGLFVLGQGATRIEDLGLWTRTRVESTFYDDLRSILREKVGAERVIENYTVPDVPGAENYPVDYFIDTGKRPLYVFGVLNRDKARLTTIVLQHLTAHADNFDSMVVYSDVDEIPKTDAKRLMNAANDSVATINDRDVIRAKIQHRLAA